MDRYILRNLKRVSGETIDIVIEQGTIADILTAGRSKDQAVNDQADAEESNQLIDTKTIDYEGEVYVSSGWIDMHVHAFAEFSPYGDEIDEIGVRQGVTTIVDAGSCGADRIGDLIAHGERSLTRLFAFLNISRIGLLRIDELSQLEWIDKGAIIQAYSDHRDSIVGLKARISSSVVGARGLEPLCLARKLSDETGLPLMVHIGSGPPSIEDILPLMASKDMITHYLNGKKNNLFQDGRPIPALLEALEQGVKLDVGHGTASFSFKVAGDAKRHGIGLHTISSDIYRGNRLNGPVYSLANVLSKFLYLGYALEEVISAVTSSAADWLGKPELGRISIGDPANLTLFKMMQKSVSLVDSEGETRQASFIIEPKGVVMNGTFIECEARP